MSDSRRKRVLFVAEAVTLAHVTRPLVLAQSLDPDLFDVHFACDDRYGFVFKDMPFPRWPIRTIPAERFLQALAAGAPLYDQPTLASYVTDDLRLLEEVRPDLVVGDFRLSLAVSAPVRGVPYGAVANAHWSPYTTRPRFPLPEHWLARLLGVSVGTGLFHLIQPLVFAAHARPLNRVRKEYGLPALGNLLHVYTHGDYTLYADTPGLVPTRDLPPSHRYLGPVLWSPAIDPPPWWGEIDDSKACLYVTLGSSGQVELLPLVIKTLSGLPVTVLVATAGRLNLGDLPPNVRAANYLPGEAAARRSALVVCNGGSATVYQALNEGTPILGLASNMDQYLTMSAVRRAGAGILLRAGQASSELVRRTVTELLEDRRYASAAKQVAEEFALFNAPARFRSFVQDALSPVT